MPFTGERKLSVRGKKPCERELSARGKELMGEEVIGERKGTSETGAGNKTGDCKELLSEIWYT
jgi:hypothetical protein